MTEDRSYLDLLFKQDSGSKSEFVPFVPVEEACLPEYLEGCLSESANNTIGVAITSSERDTTSGYNRQQTSSSGDQSALNNQDGRLQSPSSRRKEGLPSDPAIRKRVLNNMAQHRYRTKKRARQDENRAAVEELAEKVAELKVLKEDVQKLEDSTSRLQEQVQQAHAAVTALLDSAEPSSLDNSSTPERQHNAHPGSGRGEPAGGWEHLPKAERAVAGQKLEDQWKQACSEMAELLNTTGVDSQNPALAGPADSWSGRDPARDDAIDRQINKVMGLCIDLHRALGIQPAKYIHKTTARLTSLACKAPTKQAHWLEVAKALQLQPQQRQQLLQFRREALAALDRIYVEREVLNREVARAVHAAMFAVDADPSTSEAPEGLMAAVEKLEHNLNEEMQKISESDYFAFHDLLNPVQGGLFIVKAFPYHCDIFALANAVVVAYGEGEDSQK